MKGYGQRIRYYRKKRNLSQEELGSKLDVTKSYISKLENEKTPISLETLNRIAEILSVEITELFENKKLDLPDKLLEAGTDWIILGEKLEKQGITPEQVEQWAKIVKSYNED